MQKEIHGWAEKDTGYGRKRHRVKPKKIQGRAKKSYRVKQRYKVWQKEVQGSAERDTGYGRKKIQCWAERDTG